MIIKRELLKFVELGIQEFIDVAEENGVVIVKSEPDSVEVITDITKQWLGVDSDVSSIVTYNALYNQYILRIIYDNRVSTICFKCKYELVGFVKSKAYLLNGCVLHANIQHIELLYLVEQLDSNNLYKFES